MMIVLMIALVILHVGGCGSAKIAMLPLFTPSHAIVMGKLALELNSRGHEVEIFVGEGEASPVDGKQFVKLFKYSEEMARASTKSGYARQHVTDKAFDTVQMFDNLFKVEALYCDSLLSDPRAFASIKTADILIGDALYPCSSLVADWLTRPNIIIMMSTCMIAPVYHIDNPLSYIPQDLTGLSSEMGLLDRIQNIRSSFVNKMVRKNWFYPSFKRIKDKYNIQPAKTIEESLFTVDLVIWPVDFAIEHARPMMPYVREVGYFMPSPAQPLPAELEEFMQESGDEGVIFVSFGTYIMGVNEDLINMMSTAFAMLPQKVLWKLYPGYRPRSVSPNVMIVQERLLPQNDILGHNKTRLFITHAGANGLAESAYHGVPVVCSPFFGDQLGNAQGVNDAGIGEVIRINSVTAEQFVGVINKVLNGESYKRNTARVSHAMKNRVRTPVQEAADLVEYVHALGGHMDHLKPRSLYMPFYQVYMLDVMAVLALVLVVIIVVIVGLVRLVARAWSSKVKTT